jgi:hypothetical protein
MDQPVEYGLSQRLVRDRKVLNPLDALIANRGFEVPSPQQIDRRRDLSEQVSTDLVVIRQIEA